MVDGNLESPVQREYADQVKAWDALLTNTAAALQRAPEVGMYFRPKKVTMDHPSAEHI